MGKRVLRWLLIGLGIALVIIQFVRPEKNNGDSNSGSADITIAYNAPAEVNTILRRACYDCHSNHTNYPWYSNIQPVGWWLADHVDEGKDELNLSEFGTYKTKRKLHKLKEVVEEVTKGDMPLNSYLWVHGEAKLSESDKQLLTDWAKGVAQRITLEEGVGAN